MNTRLSFAWGGYQKNICNGFSLLQQRGEFVDMTLAADGHHVQVHRMVLCLVSPYIKELVAATQCAHPVIFLNNLSSATLGNILEYAYTGEALVHRDKIKEFLQACKSLHIKGLENTTTVELHRETESNMCQETINTQPEEDNNFDTSFDDGECDEIDPSNEKNDQNQLVGQKLEIDDKTRENSTINDVEKKLAKKQLPNTSSSNDQTRVQYTISNHGHVQIILNRHLYCYNYQRIRTNEIVWRCLSNKKKCPATVSTKNGIVTRRIKAHNHAFVDKAILKRLQQGLVYSDLREAQNSLEADKKVKVQNKSSNISVVTLDEDDVLITNK